MRFRFFGCDYGVWIGYFRGRFVRIAVFVGRWGLGVRRVGVVVLVFGVEFWVVLNCFFSWFFRGEI